MAVVREDKWLELPDNLTVLVTDKLSRCDFIRFGAVCKSWKSIIGEHPRRSVLHQLPVLLLPCSEHFDDIHNIYECIEKRIYSRFKVWVPYPRMYRGSNYGWVVTIRKEDWATKVVLTNPLLPTSEKTIELPPLKGIGFYDVTKAVLSANPALNPNYFVMVILRKHGMLAFFKPADDKVDWTFLQTQSEDFDDALYHRDQFYFVDESGLLFNCDLNHPHNPVVSRVASTPPFGLDNDEDKVKSQYLVQLSSGDLLLVKRFRENNESYTTLYTIGFSVYKMNPLVDLEWIQVQNLCGDTVFLSHCYSSSLRASDFPGCKPNCIYFVDYGHFSSEDARYRGLSESSYVGIFNLEDESFERQPLDEYSEVIDSCPPFWIEPTPLQQC